MTWCRARDALRASSTTARVTGMLAILVVLTAWLSSFDVDTGDAPGPAVPWWVLIVLFALAEVFVLHVQIRREAQTVSLCEIPLLLGLFFSDPTELVVARVLGPALVFVLVRKQPWLKVAFNTALQSADVCLALVVFSAVSDGTITTSWLPWAASGAAVVAAGSLDAVATTLVIGAVEGRIHVRDLVREPATESVRALGVATVAMVAVSALTLHTATALPLVGVGFLTLVAYRAYARLSERHLSLERLYRFSQAITSSPEVDGVLRSVLSQAKEMLHAENAEITFVTAGESAETLRVVLPPSGRLLRMPVDERSAAHGVFAQVVSDGSAVLFARGSKDVADRSFLEELGYRDGVLAPLRGDAGVMGTVLVANRLGDIRTFDHADVRLLETVANHASVALQNGRLIDQLRHDALHDNLTGLPNRAYLQKVVEAELARLAAGVVSVFAVGLMDLNGFKEVNDTLGHQHGDELLRVVARRLTGAAGAATVARLGGDEFAFLIPYEPGGEQDVIASGRRMLSALEQPIDLDGVKVEVGAALGLSFAPEHGRDAPGLLKRADLAMYDAKHAAAAVRVYEPAMDTTDPQRLALVGELRSAVERSALTVVVQPKARLHDGTVDAVEALVRWQHPTLGFIPPDEFVPVAERSGLIRPLTMLVLDAALQACARWRDGGHEISAAVNLSARSLVDPDLVSDVASALDRHAVPARLLTLEITESSVMTDPARAMGLLTALHEMGVRLSIDDFGTGYSSLSYLKRLPVDEVKIDRSFVTHMTTDSDDATIVRSIIDLAGNLGLDVVAEGVEDSASRQRLSELGCTYMQGYHLSRPMPILDFDAWITSRRQSLAPGVIPAMRAAPPRTGDAAALVVPPG